jgi:hypothetical protein
MVELALLQVPMLKLLQLWSELEQAYYGDARWGGDTAEIYAYRFLSMNPSRMFYTGEIKQRAEAEDALQAKAALLSLCRLFAKERDALITIDGLAIDEWEKVAVYDHRAHVKVVQSVQTR